MSDDDARHAARAQELIKQINGTHQPTGYAPTPDAVIEKMLDRMALRRGDRLVDLGCGDGRVLIAAARRGLMATGVEADTRLAMHAAARVARVGPGKARVALGSYKDAGTLKLLGVPEARGVYLFLRPWSLDEVLPLLYTRLPAGARIMSYGFRPKLFRWRPMAKFSVPGFNEDDGPRPMYVWKAPGRGRRVADDDAPRSGGPARTDAPPKRARPSTPPRPPGTRPGAYGRPPGGGYGPRVGGYGRGRRDPDDDGSS